jgi:transcriptional regulator
MYIPAAFVESDLTTLHDFIERHSFGVMVSQVDGCPFATHLPFLLERESGPYGSLVGHTARANPQCDAAGDQTVIAIFSGPHTYISPSWYEAENVVPTWNYSAVHVTGRLQIIDDSQTLTNLVTRLTDLYERSMPNPWSFDGSTTFAERLLTQIIGFRILIERMEGKWKMSQNQPVERQQKVVAALRQRTDPDSQGVADLMDGN